MKIWRSFRKRSQIARKRALDPYGNFAWDGEGSLFPCR
jgi:hypothetical protein